MDASGKFLFVANQGSNNISVLAIGELVANPGLSVRNGTSPAFVAIDQSGDVLYVADSGSGDIAEFSIGGSGSLTAISGSPVPVQTSAAWIAAE